MGKLVFAILITQVITNGWWYCATMQDSLSETPILAITVIASLGGFAMFVCWILDNWDK